VNHFIPIANAIRDSKWGLPESEQAQIMAGWDLVLRRGWIKLFSIYQQNGGKLAQLETFLEGRRVRLLVEALHRLGLYDW